MDNVTITKVITKSNDSADSNMIHYTSRLQLWSKKTTVR